MVLRSRIREPPHKAMQRRNRPSDQVSLQTRVETEMSLLHSIAGDLQDILDRNHHAVSPCYLQRVVKEMHRQAGTSATSVS
jgi:hypothetical protein